MRNANSGLELPPEPSLPDVVGGGVVVWPGVAVSPWNDWNGVEHGVVSSATSIWSAHGVEVTIGVAVSPWNDWNAVSEGDAGGVSEAASLWLAEVVGVDDAGGVSEAAWLRLAEVVGVDEVVALGHEVTVAVAEGEAIWSAWIAPQLGLEETPGVAVEPWNVWYGLEVGVVHSTQKTLCLSVWSVDPCQNSL